MIPCYRIFGLSCLGVSLFVLGCGGGSGSTSSNGGGTDNNTPPTPTVTSISPPSVMAGSATTQLTVNGTNFQSTSTVQVGGVADATSYVNSKQLVATVTATQMASAGQLSVIVLNGSLSSGSGAPINFEVDNPAPTISSVSPSAVAAGATSPVISVIGTGFVSTTVIKVNGNARATAFVSSTQVNVTLSDSDVASSGSLALTAVNATPGGGTSAASSVSVSNPAPGNSITVSPARIVADGTSPVTVTITGTNFVPSSTVQVNGISRASTYVSSTNLTFLISATDLATSQILYVNVTNPVPGGGSSGSASVTILEQTPTPVLSQVAPAQIVMNTNNAQIVVTGSNLAQQVSSGAWVATSRIQWNGTPLTILWYSFYGNL